MIINGKSLIEAAPIKNMVTEKKTAFGLSYGLSEVGYDFRLKQSVTFFPPNIVKFCSAEDEVSYSLSEMEKFMLGFTIVEHNGEKTYSVGRTALASSVEEFQLPDNLWGEVRNKSSNARQFIDASITTDIEPSWSGFLTIEIIFHANKIVHLPSGYPIAKVVFHELQERSSYNGKYQNQADRPVPAIIESNR